MVTWRGRHISAQKNCQIMNFVHEIDKINRAESIILNKVCHKLRMILTNIDKINRIENIFLHKICHKLRMIVTKIDKINRTHIFL